MLNKEFFDKHFKMHNKIVLFTPDNIKITISKAYHFHFNGGIMTLTFMTVKTWQSFVLITSFQLKDMMICN